MEEIFLSANIGDALNGLGVKWQVDNEGYFTAVFKTDEVSDGFIVVYSLEGDPKKILSIKSLLIDSVDAKYHTTMLEIINNWNSYHRWPKVCLQTDETKTDLIIATTDILVGQFAPSELLSEQIKNSSIAIFSAFEEISSDLRQINKSPLGCHSEAVLNCTTFKEASDVSSLIETNTNP